MITGTTTRGTRGPIPRRNGSATAYRAAYASHSATYGTGEIGRAFKDDATEARKLLRQYWRLPTNSRGVSLLAAVRNYLTQKGFQPNRSYVFLFAKTGNRLAEKAHHFTSILTWRILQERIESETTSIPVATGEDIGLSTRPRMVKFWDDPAWKKIFEGHSIDPRSAQLGMWCYLAENYKGVSMIGMRSGMIEVPALLGIRTLYLEEAHNQQAQRMEKVETARFPVSSARWWTGPPASISSSIGPTRHSKLGQDPTFVNMPGTTALICRAW